MYYDDYESGYGKSKYYSDEKKIKRDFMNYANLKTKKIDQDGMEKMGKTLDIDIYTDVFITYFFFRCGCKSMEEVTESEYITGLKYFKCNDLNELKSRILHVRETLLDLYSKEFKEFYNFLFKFNCGKGKILSYEVVEVYFNDLFSDQFPIVKHFILFLKDIKKSKGLNKDQWECFLDFLLNQGISFPKDYKCEDYYPLIIDEFYNWYCDINHINKNKKENDEEDS